jgi:hypothetical protein
VRFQDGDLFLENGWEPKIIGIQEGDIPSSGAREASVARSTLALILVARVLEIGNLSGMLSSVVSGDIAALVGRAIVNQEQFPSVVSLIEDAEDGFLYEPFSIEERDDYGYQWPIAHVGKSTFSRVENDATPSSCT